jgi:D-alanyl-D-alanine carboxypeptidase
MAKTYTRKDILGYVRAIRMLTALCLVLAITCVVLSVLLAKKPKENPTVDSGSSVATSSAPVKDKEAAILAKDLQNWNLVLVNTKSPLPEGYKIETEAIASAYARDKGMSYDKRAVEYLNQMCAAAEKDGITLLAISSYRPHERQQVLFDRELNEVKAENPGISEEDAKKKAATEVAYPGTSEHELGLAVDLNSVEQTFEHTKQFTWLSQYANDYGFVLRYPKDKEEITGIIYEPWHYRYVGVEHAKKMTALDMCLEEYIDYLKENK